MYTEDDDEVTSVNKPKKEKMTLTKLAKQINSRFDRVEARIDNLDTRLDYIVKANNLKDLPISK